MKQFIYADNAATTKLNKDAFQEMLPWLCESFGNASQPYSFSREPKNALANARKTIAMCINADPEEIYFTSGGTESDNWALKGTMFAYGDNRTLITSKIEHHAIIRSAEAIERMGFPVVYLPVDSSGIVTEDILSQFISDSTKLVSIMLSNNEIGSIQPIAELAALAHAHGAMFHTDAVQAVGHIPVDVQSLGVDMLSASAHKFNGPKGIGFLYIRNGTKIDPYENGGAQEHGKRAGTENVASIVGMAKALKINCSNLEKNMKYVSSLEERLVLGLKQSGIMFRRNGSAKHIPGNISLSFKDADGESLLHRLDLMGICVSTGSACDSVNTQISHVLQAINLKESYAKGTIRISLSKENTEEEVDKIVSALVNIRTL